MIGIQCLLVVFMFLLIRQSKPSTNNT